MAAGAAGGRLSGAVAVVSELVPAGTAGGRTPAVVLLLNPQDCADRIEALAAWNALHESGKARVVGLVSDVAGGPDALATIRQGAGLAFPLRPIAHRRMVSALLALNYTSTPVVLVMDPQDRLRMAVPLFEAGTEARVESVMREIQAASNASEQSPR
jgi:hypothetical protein